MDLDSYLTKKRLSLEAFSGRTGLHKSTISRIRRGLVTADEATAEIIIAATGGRVTWNSLRGRRVTG